MLKEEIKKRLDDVISDIFADLQNEFAITPEMEDVGEGCRRSYFIDQIADSIMTETLFDLKQEILKGENA